MDKKMLLRIAIVVVIVIAIVAISVIGILGGRSSPKRIAKDFSKAIMKEEKLEKYFEDNINFSFSYAFAYSEIVGTTTDETALAEDFERTSKAVSQVELKNYKEESVKTFMSLFDQENIKKIKFKDLTEKKVYKLCPILEYTVGTYDITTKNNEKQERKVAFIFYGNALISVVPVEYVEAEETLSPEEIEEIKEESKGQLMEEATAEPEE